MSKLIILESMKAMAATGKPYSCKTTQHDIINLEPYELPVWVDGEMKIYKLNIETKVFDYVREI